MIEDPKFLQDVFLMKLMVSLLFLDSLLSIWNPIMMIKFDAISNKFINKIKRRSPRNEEIILTQNAIIKFRNKKIIFLVISIVGLIYLFTNY